MKFSDSVRRCTAAGSDNWAVWYWDADRGIDDPRRRVHQDCIRERYTPDWSEWIRMSLVMRGELEKAL